MKTSLSRRIIVLVAAAGLVLSGIAVPAAAAKGGNRGRPAAEEISSKGKGRSQNQHQRGKSEEAKSRKALRFTAKGVVGAPAADPIVEEPTTTDPVDDGTTTEPVDDGTTTDPIDDGTTTDPVDDPATETAEEVVEEAPEATSVTLTFDPARGTKNVRKLDTLSLEITDDTKLIVYGERVELSDLTDVDLANLPAGTRIVARGMLTAADATTGTAKKVIVKAPKVDEEEQAEEPAEGDETTTDPVDDGTTTDPVDDGTTTDPVDDGTTTEPVV